MANAGFFRSGERNSIRHTETTTRIGAREGVCMSTTSNPDRDANRDPITGAPGSHPIGTGVGAAGAGAAGAAIGAVAGPVGVVVGAAVGAIAGGLAGKGVAEAIDPTAEDAYWEEHYRAQPFYEEGVEYSEYRPAYQTGYESYATHASSGRRFDELEPELQRDYETRKGTSRLGWDKARAAARAAWDKLERVIPGDSDRDGK